MRWSKVENGKIVNRIVVDPDNPPELEGDWLDDQLLEIGMIDGGSGGFAHPVKTKAEVDAALEAQVQQNTNDLTQNDKKLRVMAELIFDTLKAGKSGNYSAFDGVTNKATFRDHVVARFRALN